MKSRSSARETVFILIPALALGAFALYSQRVEKVEPRGLYVEKSELVPATPLDRSEGYSHYLWVTLNYGGAKPVWWGKDGAYSELMNAPPATFRWTNASGHEFRSRPHSFAIGEELIVIHDGKAAFVPHSQGVTTYPSAEEGRYVLKHYVALPRVTSPTDEVRLRAVYALRELKPLRWETVVRRAGQGLPPVDRNPHAQILGWTRDTSLLPIKIWVVKLRHEPRQGQKSFARFDGVQICDNQGKLFRYGSDFTYGMMGTTPDSDPTIVRGRISLNPGPTMTSARPPLTLRGTISVNQNWPIPFSHRLSP